MIEIAPSIFVSYSHQDTKWKNRLLTHLNVLKEQGLLTLWEDSRIQAGADWFLEIQRAMNLASIALFLVSPDSLTSTFILRQEIVRLIERRNHEGMLVFPLLVRPVDYEAVPWLNAMQIRTFEGRALSELSRNKVDRLLANFASELRSRLHTRSSTPAYGRMPGDQLPPWPAESGIAAAHASGVKGQNVRVCAVDTGVDADHAEFLHTTIDFFHFSDAYSSPIIKRRGFDSNTHGTHNCGVIVGGHRGIAPSARLMLVDPLERLSLTGILKGINMLMGTATEAGSEKAPTIMFLPFGYPPNGNGTKDILSDVTGVLNQMNILVISPVGNEGEGHCRIPASLPGVLAVGAVDYEGVVPSFSGSIGEPPKPDIVGYGVSIVSSIYRTAEGQSLYQAYDGTSMAGAYVVGIACLLWSQNPRMEVRQLTDLLKRDALKLPNQPQRRVGAGLARFVPAN
jgi:Subtilase family/TIR domain